MHLSRKLLPGISKDNAIVNFSQLRKHLKKHVTGNRPGAQVSRVQGGQRAHSTWYYGYLEERVVQGILIKGRKDKVSPGLVAMFQQPPVGLLGWEEGAFSSSESPRQGCAEDQWWALRPGVEWGSQPLQTPQSSAGPPWEEVSQKQRPSKPLMQSLWLYLLEPGGGHQTEFARASRSYLEQTDKKTPTCPLFFPNVKRYLLLCRVEQQCSAPLLFLANPTLPRNLSSMAEWVLPVQVTDLTESCKKCIVGCVLE